MKSEGEEEYDDFIETENDQKPRNPHHPHESLQPTQPATDIQPDPIEFDLLGAESISHSHNQALPQVDRKPVDGEQDLLETGSMSLTVPQFDLTDLSKEPHAVPVSNKPVELDDVYWKALEDSDRTEPAGGYVDSPIPVHASGKKAKEAAFSLQLQADQAGNASYETLDLINLAVDTQKIQIPPDASEVEFSSDRKEETHHAESHSHQNLQAPGEADRETHQHAPNPDMQLQTPDSQQRALSDAILIEDHSGEDSAPQLSSGEDTHQAAHDSSHAHDLSDKPVLHAPVSSTPAQPESHREQDLFGEFREDPHDEAAVETPEETGDPAPHQLESSAVPTEDIVDEGHHLMSTEVNNAHHEEEEDLFGDFDEGSGNEEVHVDIPLNSVRLENNKSQGEEPENEEDKQPKRKRSASDGSADLTRQKEPGSSPVNYITNDRHMEAALIDEEENTPKQGSTTAIDAVKSGAVSFQQEKSPRVHLSAEEIVSDRNIPAEEQPVAHPPQPTLPTQAVQRPQVDDEEDLFGDEDFKEADVSQSSDSQKETDVAERAASPKHTEAHLEHTPVPPTQQTYAPHRPQIQFDANQFDILTDIIDGLELKDKKASGSKRPASKRPPSKTSGQTAFGHLLGDHPVPTVEHFEVLTQLTEKLAYPMFQPSAEDAYNYVLHRKLLLSYWQSSVFNSTQYLDRAASEGQQQASYLSGFKLGNMADINKRIVDDKWKRMCDDYIKSLPDYSHILA